jgi:hypothetical protein
VCVTDDTEDYFVHFTRIIYVSFKSYLSFLDSFKKIYFVRLEKIQNDGDRMEANLVTQDAELHQTQHQVEALLEGFEVKEA